MKTGIELIDQERKEQIEKHQRLIKDDAKYNDEGELIIAAVTLVDEYPYLDDFPSSWNRELCMKMAQKPKKERLIIAGALIAAEIDRLNYNK